MAKKLTEKALMKKLKEVAKADGMGIWLYTLRNVQRTFRLEYIYHEFSGFGWGMDDFITEEYYSMPWVLED